MNMEQALISFTMPALLWLVPVLWTIGYVAKNSKKVEDWGIPLILLAVSIPVCTSFVVITKGVTALGVWMGIAQSLAVWAISVASHTTYKQVLQKRGEVQS